MGKKQTFKNTNSKRTIHRNTTISEQEDSIDELTSCVKQKKNYKETPLRKASNVKRLDSSEKENHPLYHPSSVENSDKKKSKKNVPLEKELKNTQKESNRQEILCVQLNDSKRKLIDVYDDHPDMEKKLEEAIRKMEEYQKKYKCLRDLRQTEVESNFYAYRETAESRFKASQELIDSLTKDVEIKDKKLKDMISYVNDSKVQKQEIEKLSEKLKFTEQALNRANSQITYLNAKLSSRSNTSITQLKEELYSDLTGLLIRDVKTDSKKTIFDCLQTGRNGTLHFKLSLFSDSSQSRERFSYTPLFNQERDAPLLNCLPDYLTDEIIFEKDQAAMFSWRLSSALQKKD